MVAAWFNNLTQYFTLDQIQAPGKKLKGYRGNLNTTTSWNLGTADIRVNLPFLYSNDTPRSSTRSYRLRNAPIIYGVDTILEHGSNGQIGPAGLFNAWTDEYQDNSNNTPPPSIITSSGQLKLSDFVYQFDQVINAANAQNPFTLSHGYWQNLANNPALTWWAGTASSFVKSYNPSTSELENFELYIDKSNFSSKTISHDTKGSEASFTFPKPNAAVAHKQQFAPLSKGNVCNIKSFDPEVETSCTLSVSTSNETTITKTNGSEVSEGSTDSASLGIAETTTEAVEEAGVTESESLEVSSEVSASVNRQSSVNFSSGKDDTNEVINTLSYSVTICSQGSCTKGAYSNTYPVDLIDKNGIRTTVMEGFVNGADYVAVLSPKKFNVASTVSGNYNITGFAGSISNANVTKAKTNNTQSININAAKSLEEANEFYYGVKGDYDPLTLFGTPINGGTSIPFHGTGVGSTQVFTGTGVQWFENCEATEASGVDTGSVVATCSNGQTSVADAISEGELTQDPTTVATDATTSIPTTTSDTSDGAAANGSSSSTAGTDTSGNTAALSRASADRSLRNQSASHIDLKEFDSSTTDQKGVAHAFHKNSTGEKSVSGTGFPDLVFASEKGTHTFKGFKDSFLHGNQANDLFVLNSESSGNNIEAYSGSDIIRSAASLNADLGEGNDIYKIRANAKANSFHSMMTGDGYDKLIISSPNAKFRIGDFNPLKDRIVLGRSMDPELLTSKLVSTRGDFDSIDAAHIHYKYDGKHIGRAHLTTDSDIVTKLARPNYLWELSILNHKYADDIDQPLSTFDLFNSLVKNGITQAKTMTHETWETLKQKNRVDILHKSGIGSFFRHDKERLA